MRVVYEEPIQNRIREEIAAANRTGKRIEKFVLTRREMDQLWHYCNMSLMNYDVRISDVGTFCGYPLEVAG